MKLFLVAALALFMLIPVLFVGGLVSERSDRATQVEREISQLVGGPQTVLGPTLLVPYEPAAEKHSLYVIFPVLCSATVTTVTEERHRSLFKVPVYRANIVFDGEFDLSQKPTALPTATAFDWSSAEIVEGISNLHGITSDATISINGISATLVPAQLLTTLGEKGHELMLVGTRPGAALKRRSLSFHLDASSSRRTTAFPVGLWQDHEHNGARRLEKSGI